MHLNAEAAEAYVAKLTLRIGVGHGEDDVCVMQAVDYIATGGHSDRPTCTSPVITSMLISLNDRLSAKDRQKLKPYILKAIGTKGTKAQDEIRGYMARDWAIRRLAPTWFELAGYGEAAQTLRDLAQITDRKSASHAIKITRDLRVKGFGVRSYYTRMYDAVYPAVKKALEANAAAAADAVADAAVAAAVDAAVAAAVDAAAVADAAVAAVDADAAAAVVADAAVAVAAADADAVAAAAVVAAAWRKYGTEEYWAFRRKTREAVREKVRARLEEKYAPAIEQNMTSVLELLDAMIAVTK